MNPLIVIPTYNEIENLDRMIHALMALDHEVDVLVVDDDSPDGTGKAADELAKTFQNRVFTLHRQGKLGLGTAYIAGFKWGMDRGYDLLTEMDCDFSHDPKELKHLIHACQSGFDYAIGSRYTKGGGFENWPFHRWVLSKFASIYVQVILGLPIKDSTAGFICYRREVLERIGLDSVQFVGYAFQIEMKYKAYMHGFKPKELPITFADREFGKSKLSNGIIKEPMFGVFTLRKVGKQIRKNR